MRASRTAGTDTSNRERVVPEIEEHQVTPGLGPELQFVRLIRRNVTRASCSAKHFLSVGERLLVGLSRVVTSADAGGYHC